MKLHEWMNEFRLKGKFGVRWEFDFRRAFKPNELFKLNIEFLKRKFD